MAKTNQRDKNKEAFWRETVKAYKASGQTVRAFCRQRHLSEPGFYSWRRELLLRAREPHRESPTFAAVTLRTDDSRLAADEIELCLADGKRLRFRRECSPELLGKVLALLERRPC